LASRREQHSRVGRIDRQGYDFTQRVGLRDDLLVGVIGAHLHILNSRGVGPHQVPGLPVICAAPQSVDPRVDRFGLPGIEREEAHRPPQIEHAPRTAAIVCDIGAGHIARNQHGPGVVLTDGGIEHGAASTGSDHTEISGTGADGHARQGRHDERQDALHHEGDRPTL